MGSSRNLGATRRLLIAFVTAVLLAGACAFVSSAAATPAASQRDAASTRAFIREEVRIEGAFATHITAIRASANAVAEQVNASCPNVLAKAPKTGSKLQQIGELQFELDLLAQIYVAAVKPIAPIGERASFAQERLRFSDQSLEWSVHLTAAGMGYLLSLQPPNLCAQARGFATSGYTKPPAAGGRLFAHLIASDAAGSPDALIRRMRPYAPAAVAAGLKRLAALHHRFSGKLSLDGTANRLYKALYGRPAAQGGLARRLARGL